MQVRVGGVGILCWAEGGNRSCLYSKNILFWRNLGY